MHWATFMLPGTRYQVPGTRYLQVAVILLKLTFQSGIKIAKSLVSAKLPELAGISTETNYLAIFTPY